MSEFPVNGRWMFVEHPGVRQSAAAFGQAGTGGEPARKVVRGSRADWKSAAAADALHNLRNAQSSRFVGRPLRASGEAGLVINTGLQPGEAGPSSRSAASAASNVVESR